MGVFFNVKHDLHKDNINDDIDTEDYRVEEIDEKASYKRKYQREPFILMKDQIEDQY